MKRQQASDCLLFLETENQPSLHNGNSKTSKSKEKFRKKCRKHLQDKGGIHMAILADLLGVTKFSKLNQTMTTMTNTRSLFIKTTSSTIVFTEMVYRIHFPMGFLYYYAPKNTMSSFSNLSLLS